jgi:predicted dehydrogenase
MDPLQVGLIGFGLGGRVFHAPIIRTVPGLKLAAIVERSGDSARLECESRTGGHGFSRA